MTTQATNLQSLIRTAEDTFEATFARGDAAGMAKLYTEDGMVLPTGSDPIIGTKAIQEFMQEAMDLGMKQVKLNIIEVEDHGDTAIELGKYSFSGEGGQLLDQGKYIVIWKQQNGQWKLHRDIFNSSIPPQGS